VGESGNLSDMKFLFEMGDKSYNILDYCGRTPLYSSILYGYTKLTTFLLNIPDIDINKHVSNRTQFYLSIGQQKETYVLLILERCFSTGIQLVDYDTAYDDVTINWHNPTEEIKKIFAAINNDYTRLDPGIQIDCDYVLDIRYKIYFSRSLVSRLLLVQI
jgi:hypothetical protein